MANLITIADIRAVRPVASNIDTNRYSMYIDAAQNVDLKEALNAQCDGDFVYFLTQNVGVTRVNLVLDGGVYTYSGKTYQIQGVKKALALYAYARIVEGTQATVTGDSVAFLQTDWAANASIDQVRSMIQAARTQAYTYVTEVITMLCRLQADYPEWSGYKTTDAKSNIGMAIVDRHSRNQRKRKYYGN